MTTSRPTVINRQHIGPNIRAMRKEAGMTLDDLATKAEISQSHLSRMERGQTLPSFTVLAGIAAALDVSLDEFSRLEHENVRRDEELKTYLYGANWTSEEVTAALASDDIVKDALLETMRLVSVERS